MLAKKLLHGVKISIPILLLIILCSWMDISFAEEDIRIIHEKDIVRYEIENKREEEYKKDKDKTYEILKNIRIDLRHQENDGKK